MLNATIIVQDTSAPKPGGKYYSVKATDGIWYKVPPAMMGIMQPGASCSILYEDNIFNGQTYHMVKSAQPAQQQLPMQQQPPQQPAQQATQSFYQAPKAPPAFVPNREEQIFVCGALNAAIHAGQVNVYNDQVSDIATIVQKLQAVWRATLGNPQAVIARPSQGGAEGQQINPQKAGDMNDEIPW